MPRTPVTPLDPSRVINGKEGKVFLAGNIFLTWVQSIDARVVLDRTEVIRAGALVTGYKLTGASGAGTLNGFHVTSKLRKMVAEVMHTGVKPASTYMTLELSDPEQFRQGMKGLVGELAVERVTLYGVDFWETPLGHDTTGQVMDDIPFTFTDVTFDEEIAPAGIDF